MIVESTNANNSKPNHTWGSNATDVPSSSSLVNDRLSRLFFGSRDTNLYTISLDDMLKTSLIYLLSKVSKTKSWLWHHRLSHLNFGKSKKSSHQPKAEDINQEKLYLLHMDLCGPMRVRSIVGIKRLLEVTTAQRYKENKESKKAQRTILKQQYENFEGLSSETIDQTIDRLQKLIGQLEVHGEVLEQEDINLKLLRSLPSEWKMLGLKDFKMILRITAAHCCWYKKIYAAGLQLLEELLLSEDKDDASSAKSLDSIFNKLQKIMNKVEIEIMGIDNLYNNFKIVEQKVRKYVGASSGAQNLAFMTAPSTSSTNDVNTAIHAYEVSTASPNINTASPQQIYKDDLEAIYLKWQLSLLSMRAKRYYQRIGKKIFINANDTAGYDKSKVECFNCHKMEHFARECKAPRNKEGQFKNQDNTRKHGNNEDISSKAMLAIDCVGFDWSDMAEEQVQTNMALMA
ncbi:ribonuclease H-like domain-containing protein, partial [Tanacetum coccineum]